jgi:hypothetical protein
MNDQLKEAMNLAAPLSGQDIYGHFFRASDHPDGAARVPNQQETTTSPMAPVAPAEAPSKTDDARAEAINKTDSLRPLV